MKSKIKIKLLIILPLFGFLFLNFVSADAQQYSPPLANTSALEEQTNAFVPESGLKNQSPSQIISYIIKAVLSLLGVIFIVLIIYAGMIWMTSSGNEEKIEKAKKIMAGAVIGLVICLSAYAITIFVIDKLTDQSRLTPESQENVYWRWF